MAPRSAVASSALRMTGSLSRRSVRVPCGGICEAAGLTAEALPTGSANRTELTPHDNVAAIAAITKILMQETPNITRGIRALAEYFHGVLSPRHSIANRSASLSRTG
jgi:hypothetical protein